jgi:MFS family permease
VGGVVWGAVVDRAGAQRVRNKLYALAALCVASAAVLAPSFAATTSLGVQFALIAVGGFLMTCSLGPVAAAFADAMHPGVRATGLSLLTLVQGLLGLAGGSFIVGVLSDRYGLQAALALVPAFGLLAAAVFAFAARSYEADVQRVEKLQPRPRDVRAEQTGLK